jgi:hypothetical protein
VRRDDDRRSDFIPVESTVFSGHWDVTVGTCAGHYLSGGSYNILLGDFTRAPKPDSSYFVNMGNKVCWWRDTGKRAPCPPPITPKQCDIDH